VLVSVTGINVYKTKSPIDGHMVAIFYIDIFIADSQLNIIEKTYVPINYN